MKLRILIFFILGFGVGILGYKFRQYAMAPIPEGNKDEEISAVLGGRMLRNPTDEPSGMIKYQGQYMIFQYPAKAKKYPLSKADATILERADFEINDPRLSIVATASQIQEKRLDEVPGVTSRRSQKDKYSEAEVVVGVEKNPVFTTSDGREKIVFVMYNGHLYTLAVYGPDPEAVKGMWLKILPTFHFI